MNDNHRYATGVTRADQRERNQRYQDKQRRKRRWINLISQESGIPERTLMTDRNAEIIAGTLLVLRTLTGPTGPLPPSCQQQSGEHPSPRS